LRPVEDREIAPRGGLRFGDQRLELSGGVTIYGNGGSVPGYPAGMFFVHDIERQLVMSLIIVFGERPVPDYGADLSLVLRPVRYD
jgi:hypothetical protein